MPDFGANDLDAFWMPFTPNRRFKAHPRLLASAKGMFYRTPEGREVLDGTAGLWCVNAGHDRPRIREAIQKQAAEMDFAPSFNMGHPLAFQFASRLAQITPKGLDRIFFTNSGSESVDTALKIALAYHRARGKGTKTRLIGRERGYHGVGFGGISVGGISTNRKTFGSLLTGVDHLPHTHGVPGNLFTKGQPEHGAHLADDLDLNQIPYNYTVEVKNRFKGLGLIDRVPEERWMEVCDIVQEAVIKTIPKKKKCKKVK